MNAIKGVVTPDPGSYELRTAMFRCSLRKFATHPNGVAWMEWFAGLAECPERDRQAIGAFLATRRRCKAKQT